MAIKINAQSGNLSAKTSDSVLQELIKQHARVLAATVTDVTDSSGGTGGAALLAASTALVATVDGGTTLASKATAESALNTVKDAFVELFAKANAIATKVGVDNVTYSGGGTAADGTINAITVATTAATTGALAPATNAILATYNTTFYKLGVLVNKIATATGATKIDLSAVTTDFTNTVAAITVDVGTAASPGVTKVALDAELVKLRTNVATIAAKINAVNDGNSVAAFVVV